MNTAALTKDEQMVIRRALAYWARSWDFECPTLFGIEKEELEAVLQIWPNVPAGTERVAGLATLGAMRESLHGASTIPRSKLSSVLGIEYGEASRLCSKIHSLAAKVIDR
jgi:hypothetical protein